MYQEKITLGTALDGDALSTTLAFSDNIERNVEEAVEIEITVQGGAGDTDDVEIYQFNSTDGTLFESDTLGRILGIVTLVGATALTKHLTTQKLTPYFKIGVKMESGSIETPTCTGFYQKDGVGI